MAKAAGYMTKAAGEDKQGTVKGNRYGISKPARAPEWVTISRREMGIIGQLISEMNERCKEKYDPIYRERNQLRTSLKHCQKSRVNTRRRFGKKLQAISERIDKLPIVASKYQLIFKTAKAFWTFMGWAIGAGWSAAKRPMSRYLEEFNRRMESRKQNRIVQRNTWDDETWLKAVKDYKVYENFPEHEFAGNEWNEYASNASGTLEFCQ